MNVSTQSRVTQAAEGLPRRRFTVAEVEAMVAAGVMKEDERIELVGGELVPMSPKGNRHEVVKTALLDRWYRVRPLKGLSGRSVLLVVEIADSSLRYDMGRKAALYASFGVRELWVIDAAKLVARVFRAPGDEGFGEVKDFDAAERLLPLAAPDAFALRLDELELD